MDLQTLVNRFNGIPVTIVTEVGSATGEVVNINTPQGFIAIKLAAPFGGLTAGTTAFFNIDEIIAIG